MSDPARSRRTTARLHSLAAGIVLLAASVPGALAKPGPVGPPEVASKPTQNDLNPRPLGTARASSTVQPADAQSGPGALPTTNGVPIVRTALALGGVLAIIVILGAVARRAARASPNLAAAFGAAGRSPAGLLEVLGRYPIGRGQTLVLLKLDRRILLLSQTAPRLRAGGGGMSLLCEVCDPDDVASILMRVQEAAGDSAAARFGHLLEKFDTRHHGEGDGVVEVSPSPGPRQVRTTEEGDRSELWDDRAPEPERVTAVAAAPGAHSPALRLSGADAYAELRDRLASARSRHAAPGGGGRR